MKTSIRSLLTLVITLLAIDAFAQTKQQREQCEKSYPPKNGQPGKDVIWIPTPDELVTAMLKTAQVTPEDIVYDLGSGDGKIPIAAAKSYGVRAVGIEYNPLMVNLANCLVRAAGVTEKVKIIEGDIFKTDFSTATVLTLYLLPSLNQRLMPTILNMKPGTRVVSHSFLMGEWRPDQHIDVNGYDNAYLWIVPAQVKGTWTFEANGRKPLKVEFDQLYQTVWGFVTENGGDQRKIERASLRGDQLEFGYNGANGFMTVTGTVTADGINGKISSDSQSIGYVARRS